MENHAFKVAGIRNLMRTDYGLSGNEIDLHAEVDGRIQMRENWRRLKSRVLSIAARGV